MNEHERSKKIARMMLELDSAIFEGIMKAIPDDYQVYSEYDDPVTKWDIAYTWLLERIDSVKD